MDESKIVYWIYIKECKNWALKVNIPNPEEFAQNLKKLKDEWYSDEKWWMTCFVQKKKEQVEWKPTHIMKVMLPLSKKNENYAKPAWVDDLSF